VALHHPVAAGRVRVEPTARLDSQICCLLHRLHGEVFGRMDDDSTLATDPGDKRGPVFLIMPPPWFALLAAPTRAASQVLFSAVFGLAFLAGGVTEVIRFDRACQLTVHFVGHGGIPQPPAPAITGPAMDSQLPGNAARRTRQAQQEGRQNPVRT